MKLLTCFSLSTYFVIRITHGDHISSKLVNMNETF